MYQVYERNFRSDATRPPCDTVCRIGRYCGMNHTSYEKTFACEQQFKDDLGITILWRHTGNWWRHDRGHTPRYVIETPGENETVKVIWKWRRSSGCTALVSPICRCFVYHAVTYGIPLKPTLRFHDANFVVTEGTTGCCRYDNRRCHQWRQSCLSSSPVAPEVVVTTASGATSGARVGIVTMTGFQWYHQGPLHVRDFEEETLIFICIYIIPPHCTDILRLIPNHVEDNDLPTKQNLCHDCWWPGELGSNEGYHPQRYWPNLPEIIWDLYGEGEKLYNIFIVRRNAQKNSMQNNYWYFLLTLG